jgi:hypothetical protein
VPWPQRSQMILWQLPDQAGCEFGSLTLVHGFMAW